MPRLSSSQAILILVVTTCLTSWCLAHPARAGESSHLASIKKNGVLRVGMFAADTPPFYFVDKQSGEMVGFDVDLAKNLAKLLDVKVDIQRFGPPYAKLTDALDQGVVDVLISYASITPQRAEKYSAVIYEYSNFGFLMDLAKLEKDVGREIITPEEFNAPDVKILVQKETPFEAILLKFFPNCTTVNCVSNNNVQLMVNAMDRDDAHVAFDRELVFLIYSRLDPADYRRFYLHPMPNIVNPVGMMLLKGSDVAPLFQQYVDNRDDTLELAEIIDKYMKFRNAEGGKK